MPHKADSTACHRSSCNIFKYITTPFRSHPSSFYLHTSIFHQHLASLRIHPSFNKPDTSVHILQDQAKPVYLYRIFSDKFIVTHAYLL
jgi:hypothetical protein